MLTPYVTLLYTVLSPSSGCFITPSTLCRSLCHEETWPKRLSNVWVARLICVSMMFSTLRADIYSFCKVPRHAKSNYTLGLCHPLLQAGNRPS